MSEPIYLPAALAEFAELTTEDNPHYALSGVRVRRTEGNHVEVEATDGRSLATWTGPDWEMPGDWKQPSIPLPVADATEAIVSAVAWRYAFGVLPKRPKFPMEKVVALALGQEKSTFIASAPQRQHVIMVANQTGKWPNVAAVYPQGQPVVSFCVDARRFAELLNLAGALADREDEYGSCAVRIDVFGPDRPIVVGCSVGGGRFQGLIMPLAPPLKS